MAQRMIPCFFMRGGTSRGTFFLKEHLPSDQVTANKVLLEVMGSPDPRQIDGLGGGTSTTSKVAIISVSEEPGVDIDYQFAQVMGRWKSNAYYLVNLKEILKSRSLHKPAITIDSSSCSLLSLASFKFCALMRTHTSTLTFINYDTRWYKIQGRRETIMDNGGEIHSLTITTPCV